MKKRLDERGHQNCQMKDLTIFATLCALFFFFARDLRAADSTYTALPEFPFVYVSDAEQAELPEISDSLFNAAARGIRFRVNRTELQPNDPFIPLYRNHIAPMMRDRGLILRRIIVRGAASPEGPYDNNCRLGVGRMERLIAFISSMLGDAFDTSRIESTSICEDYEYLTVLMRQAGDAETEAVERIWQASGGDERYCKTHLMALNGGRTWRRLLKQYFPTLRQARVMLFFGRRLETATNLAGTAPTPLSFTPVPMVPTTETAFVPAGPLLPFAFATPEPKERLPLIAVRTNLIHDFFYMPNFGFAPGANIQLEYFPRRGHYTFNAGFTFTNHRHWSTHKFFQVRDAQLEVRRYFRQGHPYRGAYLGLYAHGFAYGIGFSATRGWEGEGFGGGLTGGYTLKLTRSGHFRLELMAAVGYLTTTYDPYVWGNPITGTADGKYYYDYTGKASRFKKRNHRFNWMGPTNLGVQLTYDIIYRKHQKGGAR